VTKSGTRQETARSSRLHLHASVRRCVGASVRRIFVLMHAVHQKARRQARKLFSFSV
jgi:hypothetical protein